VKLRRNGGLKATVLAGTVGLMLALFGLVRANPQITNEVESAVPAPDYERFFTPNGSRDAEVQRVEQAPHTRTRAS